jgi:uncharacterized UPF0160 family protein
LNKCQEDQSLIEENQNEILFTVAPRDDGNSHVGTISVSGFALKKKLPLRGLRDEEFSQQWTISAGSDCPSNRFSRIFKNFESALSFAKLALETEE